MRPQATPSFFYQQDFSPKWKLKMQSDGKFIVLPKQYNITTALEIGVLLYDFCAFIFCSDVDFAVNLNPP